MREKILKILEKYEQKIDDRSIFFLAEIPEKKIKNAIEKYAPSVQKEDVLVLIDDTVFGKATEGLLITNDFLYANEAFEKVKKFELNQIKNVVIVEGVLGCTLYINDKKVISATQPSKSAMRFIAEMLREISEVSKAESEKYDQPSSVQDALVKLKSIFEMGLISKEEYDEKRKEYIAKL